MFGGGGGGVDVNTDRDLGLTFVFQTASAMHVDLLTSPINVENWKFRCGRLLSGIGTLFTALAVWS